MKYEEKDILKRIEEIPPIPDIALRVLRTSENPNTRIQDIVNIIKYDQGITAKLLKICNSSFFGLSRKINTINEAVIYIGQNTLVNLIFATCASVIFKKQLAGYFLEKGELWRHSVATAICSQIISKRFSIQNVDVAFTAGLLHDIGKIILNDMIINNDNDEIIKLVEKNNLSFEEAEKEVFGINHSDIGGLIAERWKFPIDLVQVIKYHHSPEKALFNKPLVYIIHLSNIITLSEGIGVGIDGMAVEISPEIYGFIHITEKDVDSIVLTLSEELKKAEEIISM